MRFALVAVLTICVCGPVFAAKQVGSVVALQGKVTAVGEKDEVRRLALKSPVNLNERIVTAVGAKVQMILDDDSVISQGENSEMTIDEYVYTPGGSKESECSVTVAKGVMRVVTGAITRINPDRFKVKARNSTIGIRGCEIVVRVEAGRVEVYVLEVPHGRSIVISRHGREEEVILPDRAHAGTPGELAGGPARATLNVPGQGRVVYVIDGRDFIERPLTSGEDMDLIGMATPGLSRNHSGVPLFAGQWDETPNSDDDSEDGSVPDPTVSPEDDGQAPRAIDPELPFGGLSEDEVNTLSAMTGLTVEDIARLDVATLGQLVALLDAAPWAEPLNITVEPAPVPSPGGPVPALPVRAYTTMGSGADWSWGVWDTDGVIDGIAVSSSRMFAMADYSAIADGGILYDFNGAGDAAALLTDGGVSAFVRGSASVNVRLGKSILAEWSGAFLMNNASGDSLSFDVTSGSFQNGLMTGSSGGFSMSVGGRSFTSSDIAGETIIGNLVGIGGGTPPSGAIGTATFALTGGATADAIFASDVTP